jgi:hypothetical protein
MTVRGKCPHEVVINRRDALTTAARLMSSTLSEWVAFADVGHEQPAPAQIDGTDTVAAGIG